MPRKRNFWKELPIKLRFCDWTELVVRVFVGLIMATILGAVIGGLFARIAGKPGLIPSILIWTSFFALLRSAKKIYYFFRFLYKYAFNK